MPTISSLFQTGNRNQTKRENNGGILTINLDPNFSSQSGKKTSDKKKAVKPQVSQRPWDKNLIDESVAPIDESEYEPKHAYSLMPGESLNLAQKRYK